VGGFISDRYLKNMNRHCVRTGEDQVLFEETNPTDYIKIASKETHRQSRMHIRDRLGSITWDSRANYVADAWAAKDALEPSHRTWDEYKEAFRRPASKCSETKIVNTLTASHPTIVPTCTQSAITDAPAPKEHVVQEMTHLPRPASSTAPLPKMPVEVIMKLLDHTSDAAIKNRLVQVMLDAYAA